MHDDETGLGATIRAWRNRLSPEAVGLPSAHVRRAVGLRREELADLTGISVDYVVRLEQGRATTPSAQVIAALARALRLTDTERDHLYRLAGLAPPTDRVISDHIPPGMARMLGRLGDAPVGVFAADWRLIWWNRSWAAVIGDPSGVPPEQRSFVRVRFPSSEGGAHLSMWPIVTQNADATDNALVADLRDASARFPEDPRIHDAIHRALQNPRFAQLWKAGGVAHHTEDRKTILHPTIGPITVECDVLAHDHNGLKVVVYTAEPGSDDESKLALACVAGVGSRT